MLPLPAGREAGSGVGAARYERHRPERTLLYHFVQEYYPAFKTHLAEQGSELPGYVEQEFEDYLKCGQLEHGFLRVRCDCCHAEHLVAFSCKRRGFCPSRGARRMAENAALLVDEVFPEQPVRQWVLSVPYPLRFLFASRPAVMGEVLGIVYRHVATSAGSLSEDRQTRHTWQSWKCLVPVPKDILVFMQDDGNELKSCTSGLRCMADITGHNRFSRTATSDAPSRHSGRGSDKSRSPRGRNSLSTFKNAELHAPY